MAEMVCSVADVMFAGCYDVLCGCVLCLLGVQLITGQFIDHSLQALVNKTTMLRWN